MFKSTKGIGILSLITLVLLVIFVIAYLTSKDSVQTDKLGQMRISKHPFGIGSKSILPNKSTIV